MASQEQEDGRADNAFPESGTDDDEEYDSDSEGTSALALRRREASDDDEDHQEPNGISRRPRFYEEDAEDEGAAPVEEEEEEEDYEDVVDGDRPAENEVEDYEEVSQHHREGITKNAGSNTEGTVKQSPASSKVAEDKKDAEPFVVPTAGAFYMHDDRFRYNGGVRPSSKLYGDKLVLRGVKLHGYHGVHESEKQVGQTFSVDMDAWLDMQRAGKTDDLDDTVSYTALYRTIKYVVEGNAFDLVETLGNSIAEEAFKKFPRITHVRVRIGKPQVAAEKMADFLGIEIFRVSPLKATSTL